MREKQSILKDILQDRYNQYSIVKVQNASFYVIQIANIISISHKLIMLHFNLISFKHLNINEILRDITYGTREDGQTVARNITTSGEGGRKR